ncbi:MAG: SoxR reducing system RseC family protein [Pseudomonadota bacterium]
MIEQEGTAVAVAGAQVWIEFQRQTACGHCAVNGSCGTGAVGKVLGRRPNRVALTNTLGVQVGERVVVGVDELALVTAAGWAYAVPLLGLLTAPLVVTGVAQMRGMEAGEIVSILAAVCGGTIGLVVARYSARRARLRGRIGAVLVRKMNVSTSAVQWSR